MKIYYASTDTGHAPGTDVAGASVLVAAADPILAVDGSAYPGTGDGFRYHALADRVTLSGGTYEIQASQFGTGYAAEATGLATVPGLTAPTTLTYFGLNDTAAYTTQTTGETNLYMPGAFGPNFLVAVPEPGAAASLLVMAWPMLHRKRRSL